MDGRPVELTGTEFRLLRYLFDRRGWVVSHDQILSEVWGPEYAGERDRVKLYVWYLRQKIEQEPAKPRRILTKRGLGYAFAG
jgi:two-component system KDP operon response regulator KdpE